MPWQVTGNHWLSLPCIHPADGALFAVGFLHRGTRSAIEFAGDARFVDGEGPPLLRLRVRVSGQKELVFASNNKAFYAFHANGTEVRDGDNNPATTGVFKMLNDSYNYGTPALADLDGDGHPDIIYGSFDTNLYAGIVKH